MHPFRSALFGDTAQLPEEARLVISRGWGKSDFLRMGTRKIEFLVQAGPYVRCINKPGKAIESAYAVVHALVVEKDGKALPCPGYGHIEEPLFFFESTLVMGSVTGGQNTVNCAYEVNIPPFQTFGRVDRGQDQGSFPDRIVKVFDAPLRRLKGKVHQEIRRASYLPASWTNASRSFFRRFQSRSNFSRRIG